MYIGRRFVVAFLLFIAVIVCYILRICLSIAIDPIAKKYGWDDVTQGLILSSFYWGYITTQLVGGWLSRKYGTKIVLGVSIIWASACTLIFPFTVQWIELAFIVRVLTGIGEGVSFPAAYNAIAVWYTRTEKSTVAAVLNCASAIGVVVSLGVTPIIVNRLGWESVFYLAAGCGCVWTLAWVLFVTDQPDDVNSITCIPINSAEVLYIQQNQDHLHKIYEEEKSLFQFSFLKMISYPSVLVLGYNHFAYNWGFYVFTSWLPKFLKDRFHFTLESSGLFSFLPYIFIPIIGIPSGMLVDAAVKYKFMSLQAIRKVFVALSMFVPTIFLLLLAFMPNLSVPVALLIMTLAISLAAFAGGGYQGNHVDLSTKYAAMLWGFTNSLSTIPGIFGVSITGYILQKSGWWLVFLIAAIIYTSSGILYVIFGKAEQLNFEEEITLQINEKNALISENININVNSSTDNDASISKGNWRRS